MESQFYYNVNINWENRRKGIICSPELNTKNSVCIEMANPPELPNGVAGIWSPEHLFIASISGSLMTTFLALAEKSKLDFTSFSCNAKGKLEKIEGELIMTEVMLTPTVILHNEKYKSKAVRILKKAENASLIKHSVTSKITMNIRIEVKPLLIETE